MLDFLKRPKPIKPGARALYKRSSEVVVIKEHKMPNQVTVILPKSSKAYQDFRYLPAVQAWSGGKMTHENYWTGQDIEVTISIDELEVLPDKDIAELLY